MTALKQLKAERRKLDRAIAILEGAKQQSTRKTRKGKRKLSKAARLKISIAQKKRWAAQKKAA